MKSDDFLFLKTDILRIIYNYIIQCQVAFAIYFNLKKRVKKLTSIYICLYH